VNINEYFLSAYQSLRSNLLRTLLTMLGIIIGISSVILIIALGQGATASITNELTSFGTNFFSVNAGTFEGGSAFTGSVKTLTLDDVDAILNDPSLTNVESVAPLVMASSVVAANGEDDRLSVIGTTEEYFTILKPKLISGRLLNKDDEVGFSKVALIGVDAVETFYGENFDPVGEVIRVDNRPVRIVGVFENESQLAATFNNALYIPIAIVQKQILGQDHLQEIEVSVYDTDLIDQTITDVEVLLRDRHDIDSEENDDFTVQSFQDALSTLEVVTGLLTTLIAAISGISLLVGGIGIMNIMLVTVTERTKEIGLLKAIGAKQRDILTQFLVESVVLTLAGGVIGILIGTGAAFLIAKIINIPFIVSTSSIVIAVGVSTAVGIIFGIYPARRAARLNPIDALRHE